MADKDPPSLTPPEDYTPRRRFPLHLYPHFTHILPDYSTRPHVFLFFSQKNYFCLFKKPSNEPRSSSQKVANGKRKRLQDKL